MSEWSFRLKNKATKLRRKILYFVYPFWAVFATKKKMDISNKNNLKRAIEGSGEITIIVHGIFTNYYSAVYWAVRWFNRLNVNVVSIGYNYKDDLKTSATEIKRQMDEILKNPGIEKVNMIGISLGGQVTRYYIEMLGGKEFVSKLVTVFSPLTAPNGKDFSIAQFMDELAGDKEITRRSLEQTIAMEKSFSIPHLALHGTSDLIVGKLAYPAANSENLTFIPVPGGHTLVSYNVTAMEYAHMYILYGKAAIYVP